MFTLKFAPINISTNGVNHIIAAAAVPKGMQIVITAFEIMANGSVNVTLQDSAGTPNPLTGPYPMAAQARAGSSVTPSSSGGGRQDGLFACAVGTGLDINLSGGVQVSGFVSYYFAPVS